jgi:ribosomal protein L40E
MDDQTEATEVWGRPLVCAHCGGRSFAQCQAPPNAFPATLLDPERPDQALMVFLCRDCGHLDWFLEPGEPSEPVAEPDGIEQAQTPDEVEPIEAPKDEALEPTLCVECGETIPAGDDRCPKCGWTYKQ